MTLKCVSSQYWYLVGVTLPPGMKTVWSSVIVHFMLGFMKHGDHAKIDRVPIATHKLWYRLELSTSFHSSVTGHDGTLWWAITWPCDLDLLLRMFNTFGTQCAYFYWVWGSYGLLFWNRGTYPVTQNVAG